MNLKEVCRHLGKSEITLTTSFKRTQENLKKKGILLIKKGHGKNAEYIVEYIGGEQDESRNNSK